MKNQLKSITGSAWHPEKGHPHPSSLLASLWDQLQDETLVVQESAQAIFIGNESLLSNLTFLIHYLMQNPECVKSIRAELDTLDLGTYGSGVWRDPRVLQLRYLVSNDKIQMPKACADHASRMRSVENRHE